MSRSGGLFPDDAVIRRVNGEGALLLGGGRAVLMQIAHPDVARGVAEHSDFRRDPLGRLTGTLDVMTTIVFGTREQAEQAATGLHAVHDRVRGPGYFANDPALLQWVYATLVDTAIEIHRRFLRPLTDREEAAFYDQSCTVAELLGVPRDRQPADIAGFRAYVTEMVSSLEVTDEARQLARAVLHPRVPLVAEPLVEPLLFVGRQLTAGLLPRPLREGFGMRWDGRRKLVLGAAQASCRQILPHVPAALRRMAA